MNTWFDLLLTSHSTLNGKWNKNQYKIIKMLGKGANGIVYLVERNANHFALKVGFDTLSIQSEINHLHSLNLVGSANYVVDVDDFYLAGDVYSFYVMRYILGIHFRMFIEKHGFAWLPASGFRILEQLKKIHRAGYIFGDLKSENVIVSKLGKPNLVDFGGVTSIGQSLQQFTERYDRAFWKAGTRTADPTYDLFAFAILVIECGSPKIIDQLCQRSASERNISGLLDCIERDQALRPYRTFIRHALHGEFNDAESASKKWLEITSTPSDTISLHRVIDKWVKIVFTSTILLFVIALILFPMR